MTSGDYNHQAAIKYLMTEEDIMLSALKTLLHLLEPNKLDIKIDVDKKQGKSEGFDSCDRPGNLTQIGFKSSIFQPVWPCNLMDDPKKQ